MMNLTYPFKGTWPVSQQFGDVYTDASGHRGIDFALYFGTPVLAAAKGTVIKIGCDPSGYGNYVTLSHADNYRSIYAHLSSISVRTGEYVRSGQTLGESGNSGRSTGAHLHFEVLKDGISVDPEPLFGEAAIPDEEAVSPDAWTVACDQLCVRSGPGIVYPIVDQLTNGAQIKPLEIVSTRWARIGQDRWTALIYSGINLCEKNQEKSE